METLFRPTEEEREKLRKPYGKVTEGVGKAAEDIKKLREDKLILVGDYVSLAFEKLDPDISIVDKRIEREEIDEERLKKIRSDVCLSAVNEPGTLSKSSWKAVQEGMVRDGKVKIRVKGEEDLLVIPAVNFAPPGTLVVYGLRKTGSVIMKVSGKIKESVRNFVDRRDFKEVVVGGSWAYLHPGHRYILLTAFDRGKRVLIGVTSDRMLREKLGGEKGKSYEERVRRLEEFLKEYGLMDRADIQMIDDFRGGAVERGDAIVVTDETYGNAEKINQERRKLGKGPLEIIKEKFVEDGDGKRFSSSRLR